MKTIKQLEQEIEGLTKLIEVKGSWGMGRNSDTQKRYNKRRLLQITLEDRKEIIKMIEECKIQRVPRLFNPANILKEGIDKKELLQKINGKEDGE